VGEETTDGFLPAAAKLLLRWFLGNPILIIVNMVSVLLQIVISKAIQADLQFPDEARRSIPTFQIKHRKVRVSLTIMIKRLQLWVKESRWGEEGGEDCHLLRVGRGRIFFRESSWESDSFSEWPTR
jgi:hypothetical protein